MLVLATLVTQSAPILLFTYFRQESIGLSLETPLQMMIFTFQPLRSCFSASTCMTIACFCLLKLVDTTPAISHIWATPPNGLLHLFHLHKTFHISHFQGRHRIKTGKYCFRPRILQNASQKVFFLSVLNLSLKSIPLLSNIYPSEFRRTFLKSQLSFGLTRNPSSRDLRLPFFFDGAIAIGVGLAFAITIVGMSPGRGRDGLSEGCYHRPVKHLYGCQKRHNRDRGTLT